MDGGNATLIWISASAEGREGAVIPEFVPTTAVQWSGPMRKLLLTMTLALLLGVETAPAGPFEDGSAAYQRGDYAEALKWYRLSAEQGNAGAQTNLGVMYDNGQGVGQDKAEAVKWYRLAAARGSAEAQYNLGEMYAEGQGVAQDYGEALTWYRQSAARGNADAQVNLGEMYVEGQGVAKDLVRAHMWFNLGGAAGASDGGQDRILIEAVMTPKQIAEANKLARECQQRNFRDCV